MLSVAPSIHGRTQVSASSFVAVDTAKKANVAIHWGPAEDPDMGPEGMIGGTLAHADFSGESRVLLDHDAEHLPLHFDDSEHVWVNGAVFNAFDIETVALHEIGHCLGLYHSNVRGAVMFPFVDDDFTLRRLQQDDKLGIRQLYGEGWIGAANTSATASGGGADADAGAGSTEAPPKDEV